MLLRDLRYLKYYKYEANYSAENYVDVQSATACSRPLHIHPSQVNPELAALLASIASPPSHSLVQTQTDSPIISDESLQEVRKRDSELSPKFTDTFKRILAFQFKL